MRFYLFALCLLVLNCTNKENKEDPLLSVLNSDKELISSVLQEAEKYEVQIILSEIEGDGDSIDFIDCDYRLNVEEYFYPASTVKFPIALLALEKVNDNPAISSTTSYVFENDTVFHTIREDIQKIFAVSDNDAYNRLYEYLGRDDINERLRAKNVGPLRISHRLSVPNSVNPTTKSISYWENDSIVYIQNPIQDGPIEQLELKSQIKGKGFYKDSILVDKPMDFSEKNYLPISSLHNIMKRLIVPKAFPESEIFDINAEDRKFLLNAMKAIPRDLGYDPQEYYDAYVKFFIYGDSKDEIPSNIEIYNKVGYAYGYLTDCAYIKDTTTGTEFLLTATIHVNKNGIFNDDTYEYETIGIPFLAELGRQVYNHLKSTK